MVEVIKVEDCGENIGDYDIPIHNAIIIPKGATNRDVIKAMFPDLIWDNECNGVIYAYKDEKHLEELKPQAGVLLEWLNAPYKGKCNLSEKPTGPESEE